MDVSVLRSQTYYIHMYWDCRLAYVSRVRGTYTSYSIGEHLLNNLIVCAPTWKLLQAYQQHKRTTRTLPFKLRGGGLVEMGSCFNETNSSLLFFSSVVPSSFRLYSQVYSHQRTFGNHSRYRQHLSFQHSYRLKLATGVLSRSIVSTN